MKRTLLFLLATVALSLPALAQDQAKLFEDPRLKEACRRANTPIQMPMWNRYSKLKIQYHSIHKQGKKYEGMTLGQVIEDYRRDWLKICKEKRFDSWRVIWDKAVVIDDTFAIQLHKAYDPEFDYGFYKYLPALEPYHIDAWDDVTTPFMINKDLEEWLRNRVDTEWIALEKFKEEVLYKTLWDEKRGWKCKPLGDYDYVAGMKEVLKEAEARKGAWPYYQKEFEEAMKLNDEAWFRVAIDPRPLCDCSKKENFQQILDDLAEDLAKETEPTFQSMHGFLTNGLFNSDFKHNCD